MIYVHVQGMQTTRSIDRVLPTGRQRKKGGKIEGAGSEDRLPSFLWSNQSLSHSTHKHNTHTHTHRERERETERERERKGKNEFLCSDQKVNLLHSCYKSKDGRKDRKKDRKKE